MTDQYAVFGNPIAHSKSPSIHKLFAKQTKQDINYTKKEIPLGQFTNEVDSFFAQGGKGLNITLPFKMEAARYVQAKGGQLTEPAHLALAGDAVNTLKISNNGVVNGANTDGIGLIRDLENKHPPYYMIGKSVLILGAGGAVRGVLSEIIRSGVKEIVIANRTEETAKTLAQDFNKIQSQVKIKGCGFHELDKTSVDLIINGTSASLSGDLPPLPDEVVNENTSCYDMMYGKEDTVFMKWAKKHGSKDVFDGLGMLVEQAAESFYIWRGVRPETKSVIEKIRSEL